MSKSVATFEAKYGEGLEQFLVPVDSLTPHPKNYRKHKLEAIMESLRRYGQQTPLTVQRSTGFVCKGNGTLEAAKRLGWTQVAARTEDFDDTTALQYLYADNRASDLAQNDAERTVAGLQELAKGPGLTGTLWDMDALEDLELQVNGATVVDPGMFTGGYAPDDRSEERAEREATPGTKMKEVPVVMTVAEHELFMAQLRVISGALGTKGNIATILAAVERLAKELEGTAKPLPASSAAEAKLELLKDLIIHYDDRAKDTMTGAMVAAHLQEAATYQRGLLPKAPVREVEGQTHIDDVLPPEGNHAPLVLGAQFNPDGTPIAVKVADPNDSIVVAQPTADLVEPEGLFGLPVEDPE